MYLKLKSDLISLIAPFSYLDDKFYLEYQYYNRFGHKLNLNDPQTFNEKLQWIKLNYRNPLYTRLADKLAVRSYVEEKTGTSYLTKVYGVYNDPANIDWNILPEKFVLKATHGCDWVILCKDKKSLDINKTINQLSNWLRINYYEAALSREWQYKNIPPNIMIEEYLEGDKKIGLVDYKFWCYWGEPTYITVHFDRFTDYKVAFLDANWQPVPIEFSRPSYKQVPQKPDKLIEMLSLSKVLSEGIPHCRVDLYYFNNKIYFGEITFCTGGGFDAFDSHESDLLCGKLFYLPKKFPEKHRSNRSRK